MYLWLLYNQAYDLKLMVINQLTKITFFINVTKFLKKKIKKITTFSNLS